MFADAEINPLIVPAQNNHILIQGKGIGHGLVKLFAIGGGIDDFIVVPFCRKRTDSSVYRFNLHDHSGFSAKRIVIHSAVFVRRVIPQVVQINFYQAFVLGTF